MDVKDRGAIGDGIADDTAAIRQTIADTTDEVSFPPGTYLTSGEILMPSHRSFLLGTAEVTSPIARVFRTVPGAEGIRIIGGKVTGAGVGVCVDGASDVVIDGTECTRNRIDGLWVGGTLPSTSITLRNVICSSNLRSGLSVVHAEGVLIVACSFILNGLKDPSCGVDLEPNLNEHVKSVMIINSHFGMNTGTGLYIQKGKGERGQGYRIIDCDFSNQGHYHMIANAVDSLYVIGCAMDNAPFGASIGGASRGVTFADNRILNSTHPLVLAGVENPKCYDNYMHPGTIEGLPAGGLPGAYGQVVMLGNA